MKQNIKFIAVLFCIILVYPTIIFSSVKKNNNLLKKLPLIEVDSCLIVYKLQIVRDLDSSRGSKYEVDIVDSENKKNLAVKFLWQNQLSSTFELTCKGAGINYINIMLPGSRIIKIIIDQKSLTAVNKRIELPILIAERYFPKNEYTLIKIIVNSRKRTVVNSPAYISKKKFEKYSNAQR